MVEASKKFATKKQHLVLEIKIEKKVSFFRADNSSSTRDNRKKTFGSW